MNGSDPQKVSSWLELIKSHPIIIFVIGLLVREIVTFSDIIVAWIRSKLLEDRRKE